MEGNAIEQYFDVVLFIMLYNVVVSFWDNLVLSTELIMWISHRKEIRKLTFRAEALRRSESKG